MKTNMKHYLGAVKPLSLCMLWAFCAPTHALPSYGVVAEGSANINSHGSNKLIINQTSQNAVLNWQNFNVGVAESVQFIQPNSSSVALNRVLGTDPSQILGNLSANGKVFLINPNGVLFGKNSSVNVGGLVASTLDLGNADSAAGRYRFSGNGSGDVINQGSIRAEDGGYVVLLGNRVSNEGVITAPLGTVALAAASAVTLSMAGDGLINLVVNQSALNALANNGGILKADGGAVLVSAQATSALLEGVVNTTGIIQANSLANRNGRIVLDGGDSGVVKIGGEVRARGVLAESTGGTIIATGDKVLIGDGTRVDATGMSAGGGIYIGGGWQGADPDIRQASGVYVASTATLDASALQLGNGGTVVAWSDVSNSLSTTRAYGSLLARGGIEGGNGGRIETSGHWIDVSGVRANASAPMGKSGLWLLDPDDLTVSAAATTTPAGPPGLFAPGVGPANVQNTDIEAILNTGTVVLLDTASGGVGAGNMTISANISKTAGGTAALLMNADGAITLDPGVSIGSVAGALDVGFNATTGVTLGTGSSITSNGGEIMLSGVSFTNNGATLSTDAGRWVVYSNAPATSNFGGLSTTNAAIWGQTIATMPPPSVAAGNQFIFARTLSSLAMPVAVSSDISELTVSWRIGERTGSFEIEPNEIGSAFSNSAAPDLPQALTSNSTEAATAMLKIDSPISVRSNQTTTAANTPSPTFNNSTPTTLVTLGFTGSPNPGSQFSSKSASFINQPVFLIGVERAAIVGATGTGAAVVASQAKGGTKVRLAVSVAPGDGFEISLPRAFLTTVGATGKIPANETILVAAPLPAWISFDPASMKFSSTNVPAGVLPVVVKLRGSSGKTVEVTFQ